MAAELIREPITLDDIDQGAAEALVRLRQTYAELEQDIARDAREALERQDPDDRKRAVSRLVLATFGYREP